MKKWYVFFGLGVTVMMTAIYGMTASRWAVNYADSDDLMTAAVVGGLPHPPGYGWWVELMRVLLLVFPQTPPWWVGVGFNGFWAIASVVGLWGWGCWFSKRWLKITHTPVTVATLGVGACLWGITEYVWLHALIPEVFAMTQAGLVGFGWFFMWVVSGDETKNRRGWWWVLGVFGGVLFHWHQLTVLVTGWGLGMWFVDGWRKRKLNWKTGLILVWGLVVGLGVGVVPLLWRDTHSVYSWPIEPGLRGVVRFVFRQGLTSEGSAIEVGAGWGNMRMGVEALKTWAEYMSHSLGGWIGLTVIGLWVVWRKYRWWWLLVLIAGPGLFWYLKVPDRAIVSETAWFWGVALRLRMLFSWFVMVGFLGMVGWSFLVGFRRSRYAVIVLLGGITLFWATLLWRWQLMDASRDNFMAIYAERILQSLPFYSVLVVDGDMVFAFYYQQLVQQVRADVVIVPTSVVLRREQQTALPGTYSVYADDDSVRFGADTVTWNLFLGKRVFLYGASAELLTFLGVEGDPLYARPYGYTLEISKEKPLPLGDYDFGPTQQLTRIPVSSQSWWERGLRSHLGSIHAQLAYYASRLGYEAVGEAHVAIACGLFAGEAACEEARSSAQRGHEVWGRANSYAVYTPSTSLAYASLGEEHWRRGEEEQAEYFLTRAMLHEPQTILWVEKLCQFYAETNRKEALVSCEARRDNLVAITQLGVLQ